MFCLRFLFSATLKIINLVCIFTWLVGFVFNLFCSRKEGTDRFSENRTISSHFSYSNKDFFFLKCFLCERYFVFQIVYYLSVCFLKSEVWVRKKKKSEERKHSFSLVKIIQLQWIKMWINKKTKAWFYCHTT